MGMIVKAIMMLLGITGTLFVMLQIDSLHVADWTVIAQTITPTSIALGILGIAATALGLLLVRRR